MTPVRWALLLLAGLVAIYLALGADYRVNMERIDGTDHEWKYRLWVAGTDSVWVYGHGMRRADGRL